MAFKLGGGGIRTHGTRERSTVFKTAPINRSGTPPRSLDTFILYAEFLLSTFNVREIFAIRQYRENLEWHSAEQNN